MTANDIYNMAGCNAARYAVESGAYPTAQAWEVKKTRGTDLEPDRLDLILSEILKHRDEVNALARSVRRAIGDNMGTKTPDDSQNDLEKAIKKS